MLQKLFDYGKWEQKVRTTQRLFCICILFNFILFHCQALLRGKISLSHIKKNPILCVLFSNTAFKD